MRKILFSTLFFLSIILCILCSQLYIIQILNEKNNELKNEIKLMKKDLNNKITNLENESFETSLELFKIESETEKIGKTLNKNTKILHSMILNQTHSIKYLQNQTMNNFKHFEENSKQNNYILQKEISDIEKITKKNDNKINKIQEEGIKEFSNSILESIFILKNFNNQSQLLGTAFAVDKHLIITNAHNLIFNSTNISTNDNQKLENLEILYKNNSYDLAILKTSTNLKYLEFSNQKVSNSMPAYLIGHGFGYEYSQNSGTISAKRTFNRSGTNIHYLQHDIPSGKGNSGGPVLDYQGKILGMHSGGFVDTIYGYGKEGISFALDKQEIEKIIDEFN